MTNLVRFQRVAGVKMRRWTVVQDDFLASAWD